MSMPRTRRTHTQPAVGLIEGGSDDGGRKTIERYASENDLALVDVRPAPKSLVKGSQANGVFDAIAAVRATRAKFLLAPSRSFFGDTVDLNLIEAMLDREGARLLLANEAKNRDSSLSDPKVVRSISEFLFAYECALLRDLSKRQESLNTRPHTDLLGRAPWGFRFGADGRLEPDEREQRILTIARHMRARGATLREIVDELASIQVVGRSGKPIGMTRVFEMLTGGKRKTKYTRDSVEEA
jgi:hypothetical protein